MAAVPQSRTSECPGTNTPNRTLLIPCGAPSTMNDAAVLIVEDETMILLDLEAGFEDAGFEVVGASNATSATATFDANPEQFKALVTDIRLGPGKSGWDVARHLRQTNPAIPVVYISGDSSVQWHLEGVPNSVMITKPFIVPHIISAISMLLSQLSSMDPSGQG